MHLLFIINSYRESFLKFYSQNHRWDENTIYFYFLLAFFVYILSLGIGYRSRREGADKWRFIFIGSILFFVLGFRGQYVGTDTVTYIDHFLNAKDSSFFIGSTLEPGFRILLYGLRSIFDFPQSIIIVCSFVTIYFLFKTLWEYKNNINIAISLLVFVCLYCYQSMNIMRLYMVASIMMYGSKYLIEQEYKKYALLILACCTIHYSAFVLFIPLSMYLFYRRNRRLAISVAIIATVGIIPLLNIFETLVSIARYNNYFRENDATGIIGVMLIVDYLPCLYVTYNILKTGKRGKIEDLMVCFTFVAFSLKVASYFVSIAGRLAAYFMVLTCLYLPYFLTQYQKEKNTSYKFLLYITIVWAFFRLHVYLANYLAADGIMPYYFFWQDK